MRSAPHFSAGGHPLLDKSRGSGSTKVGGWESRKSCTPVAASLPIEKTRPDGRAFGRGSIGSGRSGLRCTASCKCIGGSPILDLFRLLCRRLWLLGE